MFVVLNLVAMKTDLTFFMRIGTFGAVAVIVTMLFIIVYGVTGMHNTEFTFYLAQKSAEYKLDEINYHLYGFNSGYSSLAGVLGAGYCMHNITLPMVANAEKPKDNIKNIFVGYLLVFFTYVLIGVFGYIGLIGADFSHFYNPETGIVNIDQNYLNMFPVDSFPATLLRLLLLTQLITAHPLLNDFMRKLVINIIFRDTPVNVYDLSRKHLFYVNMAITILPLICCVFYPLIGSMIAVTSAISGFFIIYIVPIFTYLKKCRLEVDMLPEKNTMGREEK